MASASSARDGGASAEGKDDDSPSQGSLRLASSLTPSSAASLGPSVRLPASRLCERALPYGTLLAGAETFPLSRVGLCHHAILLRPKGCPIGAFIRFFPDGYSLRPVISGSAIPLPTIRIEHPRRLLVGTVFLGSIGSLSATAWSLVSLLSERTSDILRAVETCTPELAPRKVTSDGRRL